MAEVLRVLQHLDRPGFHLGFAAGLFVGQLPAYICIPVPFHAIFEDTKVTLTRLLYVIKVKKGI